MNEPFPPYPCPSQWQSAESISGMADFFARLAGTGLQPTNSSTLGQTNTASSSSVRLYETNRRRAIIQGRIAPSSV